MLRNANVKLAITLLVAVAAIFIVIAVLGKILLPFAIAMILAYIVNPVVEKLHKLFKLKRVAISFIISLVTFVVFVTIPLYIIPNTVMELKLVMSKIPYMVSLINKNILGVINSKYHTHYSLDLTILRNFLVRNILYANAHINIFSPLAKNSIIFIKFMVYIILIPFALFYSICGWRNIIKFFDELIPRSYIKIVHEVVLDIDNMLSAYLRGQFSVMLFMASYYAISIHFVGIASGFIIGVITGLLVFIPYLGILTGMIISLLVAFVSFNGIHQIIALIAVFIVGHLLEGGLVTPYLVGGKIGLNPVMIILALMIFGRLFGLVGVLLALPLSTIAVVLLRHIRRYYARSTYYNETT